MSGEIPPALGDFLPGARIASYQIEQLIGRGGMATVYRATDVRLDRMVAVKILSGELARNDAFRQRFIRESRAGAAVDHPHVIPVFEAGDADGVLFIAMRYVTGQDVRVLIDREGRLPAARTVGIVSQVASALDAAHEHGLVHRDVKPANMLLADKRDSAAADYVYLSDFGLSKDSLATTSLTGTGQFLGTLDYMSPEQISGRQVDGRTDLYALGCAAFEMLTGQPPFRREANLAVMWAQVSAQPPSVRQWCPELAPAVDDVLARALAKAPEERQSSCTEFVQGLRAACAPGAAPVGRLPPPVGPATELAFGAVGGALGLAGGAAGEATVSRLAGDSGPTPPDGYGPGSAGAGQQGGAAAYPGSASGPGSPGGSGYPGGPAAYEAGLATTGPSPVIGGYQPSAPGYGSGSGDPGYPGQPSAPGYGAQPTGPGYGAQPTGPDYAGQPSGPGYGGSGYGGAGAGYGGPASGPDGTQYQYGGPGAPSGYSNPPGGQPQRQSRGKAVPILIGLLVVIILAGVGVTVLHLHSTGNATPRPTKVVTVHPSSSAPSTPSSSPSTATNVPPAAVTPAGTVKAYYRDVNDGDYQAAWRINTSAHSLSTYSAYQAGFAGTERVALTIEGVSGETVSVSFIAYQTDGSQKDYSGSYEVEDGKIMSSSIEQTN